MELLHLFGHGCNFFRIAAGRDDLGAFAQISTRQRLPDAACAADHHRHSVLQFHGQLSLTAQRAKVSPCPVSFASPSKARFTAGGARPRAFSLPHTPPPPPRTTTPLSRT